MTRRGLLALLIALGIGIAAVASRSAPPDCLQTVERCQR